ncbi:MAG: polyphosphate kinase 2 [Cyclobacteriaceae bacterium]|nr:polyphosphate kinase 2 [Cyclobacteriaceae bacterium]
MAKIKEFSEAELKILNSNRAITHMMRSKGEISPEKVLRYIKFENELEKLQASLIKLQQWTIENKKRICILFEGRDAAGKGGAIRRITHHLNPRYYRIHALPRPTEEERGQWYFQRYINRLPNQGEIIFFDRSWYNRAIVEPVNDFCTEEEYERFMSEVNHFEEMITNDGIILLKVYFSINKLEQLERFEDIKNHPLKRWKMTKVDESAQELWDRYTLYKEKMFEKTNTEKNPWKIIEANKKIKARLTVIKYILKNVPYDK